MTTDRLRLRANFIYLGLVTVIAAATRSATNWLVAGWHGPDEHGRFAVVFQLISMLVIVGELGIVSTFGVRRISRRAAHGADLNRPVNDLVGTVFLVHALMFVALLLAAPVIAPWIGVDVALLRIAGVWLLAFGVYRTTLMVANGLESLGHALATTALFHAVWLVWLAIALARNLSIDAMVIGWSVLTPPAALLSWVLLRPLMRRYGWAIRPSPKDPVRLLRTAVAALPYAAPVMGTLVLPGVVCLLLAGLSDRAQVSFFQVCFSMGILANLVMLPVTGVLLPALTRLLTRSAAADEAIALARRCLMTTVLAVACAFVLYAAAGRFLLSLMGPAYGEQVHVLLLVAAAASFDACRLVVDQWLLVRGQVRSVVAAELLRYVLLLALAGWLVPAHGAQGAAFAALVAILANAAVKIVRVDRQWRAWPPFVVLALVLAVVAGVRLAIAA